MSVGFAFIGIAIYFDVFPDIGTLRPKVESPIKEVSQEKLAKNFRPSSDLYSQVELLGKKLKITSKDASTWTEINLTTADPYVFASPNAETELYTISLFCNQLSECISRKNQQGENNDLNMLRIPLATKSQGQAQLQLEILRKMILNEGGESNVDPRKGLDSLIEDAKVKQKG